MGLFSKKKKETESTCQLCQRPIDPDDSDELAYSYINDEGEMDKVVIGYICDVCSNKLTEIDETASIAPDDDDKYEA